MYDVKLIKEAENSIKTIVNESKDIEPKEMCEFLETELTHKEIITLADNVLEIFERGSSPEDLTIQEICSLIQMKYPNLFKKDNSSYYQATIRHILDYKLNHSLAILLLTVGVFISSDIVGKTSSLLGSLLLLWTSFPSFYEKYKKNAALGLLEEIKGKNLELKPEDISEKSKEIQSKIRSIKKKSLKKKVY